MNSMDMWKTVKDTGWPKPQTQKSCAFKVPTKVGYSFYFLNYFEKTDFSYFSFFFFSEVI